MLTLAASKQMEADLPLTSPKTNTIDPATDEAETWVMAVTGLKKPDEMELQAWLKSGVVLCNLANCLKVAPSRGTQFLVYEFAKRQLRTLGWGLAAGGGSLNAGASGRAPRGPRSAARRAAAPSATR